MICSVCNKNTAVVFLNKMENGKKTVEGLCYNCAKEKGIKPIIGCEVYVANGSRLKKENKNAYQYTHLVLLAENQQGYQNLIKLVSYGFIDGFYYKPRVDKQLLKKYHEGIIASSACLAGAVARDILTVSYEKAKQTALEYEEIFGKGNYFLELQDHGMREQKIVNEAYDTNLIKF